MVLLFPTEARGHAVGSGTALRAWRLRVGIFLSLNSSGRTMAPESTQSLPPRNISRWVKAIGAMTDNIHVSIVWKSWSLNLLERSGRVQASTGIAVTLLFARVDDLEVQW